MHVGGEKPACIEPTTLFGPYELRCECKVIGKKDVLIGSEVVKSTGAAWRTLALKLDSPPALETPADMQIIVKSMLLRPLGLQSIFNGKDLTGWTTFPDKKSKFTVTNEGTLNITDGPGDIQTKQKYGNFVLQLECFSHGEHLNSGVFFRCRPNEYQQGYEAQIRNQFTAEPQQVYVIQRYDPKTHALIGEEKIKLRAFDFGTGAIYRRVPARKQASKDMEWFTLTLVAHDNHFSTWVNGVHVTDWFDNRAPADNGRNGYRAEAGHISFQGHDPTTNLSFRNIRVAELP